MFNHRLSNPLIRKLNLSRQAAIITSASGSAYNQALDYLRPHGALVAVGLPPDTYIKANVFSTVVKNLRIVGSCAYTRLVGPDGEEAYSPIRAQTSAIVKTRSKLSTLLRAEKSSRRWFASP